MKAVSLLSFSCSPVSNVQLTNMSVGYNGGRSVEISGSNNTVSNLAVAYNGCGGIAMSGGDQVGGRLYMVYTSEPYYAMAGSYSSLPNLTVIELL